MNARPRKLLVVVVIAGLALLAFLGRKTLFPSEPSWHGKPLSAWAQQYGSNKWSNADHAATVEAELAIRQIGSNGIPFLLDLMRAHDSRLKQKLRAALPRAWETKLHLKDQTGGIHRDGAHGIAALGSLAVPAIPALIDIATHHPDEDGRYIAVFALRTIGPASEPAMPFYLQCLTNQDPAVREEASTALGSILHRPEIVIPALIHHLEFIRTSTHHWERSSAVQALAAFGTNARPALPVLLSLLNDESVDVRKAVTNWLPEIDAEAAAKAGVKRSQ